MSIEQRISIEKQIVKRLIKDALAAGYALRVHDGGEWATDVTTDGEALFNACMSTGEDVLAFYKDGERQGRVDLIYGNDGHDVIADNSVKLDDFLAPIEAWIEDTFQ